jgi:hypothetical protein
MADKNKNKDHHTPEHDPFELIELGLSASSWSAA